MHNPFEELCALAMTSQVTDSERALLDEHMRQCGDCRTLMEELHPEVSQLAPAMAELLRVDAAPPDGMRDRFLQRAKDAGLRISAGEQRQQTVQRQAVSPGRGRISFVAASHWLLSGWHPLGACATAAVLLLLGSLFSHRLTVHPEPRELAVTPPGSRSAQTAAVIYPAVVSAATVSPQVEQLRKQLEGLSERLDSATSKTAQLEASNAQLEQALSAASQQARLNSVESDLQRDASKAANAQVAALRQQLDDARSKMVTLDAVASAQEKQTTEAQARVASLKAEMDQMYAARNTAETMISSRNLHIIDVYDDNGRGGRQGAFGRVFYVEGKSLVFYAYDLPNPKRGQNFSFQLWGEGQGLEPTTYKLGLMHPDTAAHGRWVVSCDDPKILGQLRGIFIAPASPKGDPPSPSQKLMYALLGSANHP